MAANDEPYYVEVIREYILPAIVFFFMVRFLFKEIIRPMFSTGMIWQYRRVPKGANGDANGAAALEDEEVSSAGVAAATAVEGNDSKVVERRKAKNSQK
jgi:hypothetical protein